MKILFAAVFLVAQPSLAQVRAEAAVGAAVAALREAMINPTKEKLDRLVTGDLSYGHSSGFVENRQAFMDALLSGRSDFVAIDLQQQTIQVKGKTAIVRHLLQAQTNDNAKPGTVKLAVLTIWHKEKEGWKLWARQAVRPAS